MRALPVVGATAGEGAVYAVALAWLTELEALGPGEGFDLARRRRLLALGSGAAGAALAGTLLGRLVDRLAGPNSDVALRTPDRPARTPSRSGFQSVPGLSAEVTPVGDHYVVDIDLVDPVVEADGWTLVVRGLVEDELEISLDELQRRFVLVEEYSVLTCISNDVSDPLVGSSAWTGMRLREVLAAAGRAAVQWTSSSAVPTATRRRSRSSERPIPASCSRSLRTAGRSPRSTASPAARAPALYGIKNAKWLQEIELVGYDQRGYWTGRGWTDVGLVRSQSRIDTPERARRHEPTWITGVAWAGTRGIARVEVSLDDGRSVATGNAKIADRAQCLDPVDAPLAARAARVAADRLPRHRRARRAQERRGRPPHPSGASGWHHVDVEVT